MDVSLTAIPGLVRFQPAPHRDERGFFSRTFDADVARSAGIDPFAFVQDSQSRSKGGVVRGLHVRTGRGEGKLVRCASGRLFDVVVDLRPDSPTYRTWVSFVLDGDTQESIYIPPGCGHGFQALVDPSDTAYRIDRLHDPSSSLTFAWNDPELAIPWPLAPTHMSAADRNAPPLAALADELGRISAPVPG
ncbi:MAG TPA: dTDP-4-dehydrorhamnose 3,5-epimerase [Intrasporangium sp.]|nr:dTDP-4-dehydrorhamnose 3,5-epimerase [Intrasporangium sp.]